MDEFTRGYVKTALWSSYDDNGTPLDSLYDVNDFTGKSLGLMIRDCLQFQQENAEALEQAVAEGNDLGRCGHDFWITRNRHGAGFWDGDYSKTIADQLTDASHAFGELYIFVNEGTLNLE